MLDLLPDALRAMVLDCLPCAYLATVRRLCLRTSQTRAAYSVYSDKELRDPELFFSLSEPRSLRSARAPLTWAGFLASSSPELTSLQVWRETQDPLSPWR